MRVFRLRLFFQTSRRWARWMWCSAVLAGGPSPRHRLRPSKREANRLSPAGGLGDAKRIAAGAQSCGDRERPASTADAHDSAQLADGRLEVLRAWTGRRSGGGMSIAAAPGMEAPISAAPQDTDVVLPGGGRCSRATGPSPFPVTPNHPPAQREGTRWPGKSGPLLKQGCAALVTDVHVPFCRKLCFYCGCNMLVTRQAALVERYLRALDLEVDGMADLLPGYHRGRSGSPGRRNPTYLDPPRSPSSRWRRYGVASPGGRRRRCHRNPSAEDVTAEGHARTRQARLQSGGDGLP